MAENNQRNKESGSNREQEHTRSDSIGNQQKTSQTGAQNNRGDNIEQEDDQYTDDLSKSGDRNSSNCKSRS